MAPKRSDSLKKDLGAVQQFKSCFARLMNLTEPVQLLPSGMAYKVRPGLRDDFDATFDQLRSRTNEAATIAQRLGFTDRHKHAGTMQREPVNSVLVWETIFYAHALTAPWLIERTLAQCVSRLEAEIASAVAYERSAAGRIERIIAGPRSILRAIHGRSEGIKSGRIRIVPVVVSGVIVAVIAAYITHVLGWT